MNVKIVDTGIRIETCTNKKREPFDPLPHQELVKNYFIKSPHRGILLYHKLGSGKTCSSIIIADAMLQLKLIKRVYICTPGSLRKNFVNEYCRKCGRDKDDLQKYYTFITYNTNIFEGIKKLDFNDSLVIIDEAHNLINGAKNISKNPYSLYNQILYSNARVIVLTATVIFNNIFEWCLLGNLLKKDTFPNLIQGGELNDVVPLHVFDKKSMEGIISYFPGYIDEFPELIHHPPIKVLMTLEQTETYDKIFSVERKRILTGPPKLVEFRNNPREANIKQRLYILSVKHIISRSISNICYQPLHRIYKLDCLKNNNFFENKGVKYIEDSGDSDNLEEIVRIIWNDHKGDSITKKYIKNKLNEMNIEYNKDELNSIIQKIIEENESKNDVENVLDNKEYLKTQLIEYYLEDWNKNTLDIEKIKEDMTAIGLYLADEELHPFINEIEQNMKKKIKNFKINLNIELQEESEKGEKNCSFDDLLTSEGGWISKDILKDQFLRQLSPKFLSMVMNILKYPNSKHIVFSFFINNAGLLFIHNVLKLCNIKSVIYSGEVPADQRARILDKFNKEENRNGKNLQLLLITEAGCEGITLLEVEHVHLFETNTNANKTQQCIGRAARYKSHSKLPPERRKVNVWKYFSCPIGFQGKSNQAPKEVELNDYIEYYNYYTNEGCVKTIKEVYGTNAFVSKGIDEILDLRTETKLEELSGFYKLLIENSIERTGKISKIK
jgi:superfamily II DNA or RNA helicase